MGGKLGAMAAPELPVLLTSVLLVEDNPGDAELVMAYLDAAPQLSLTVVPRLLNALECLEGESIDCILLDLDLPDADRLDGLERLLKAAPTVPVVVLTGLNDTGIGEDAVRLGAQDYLVKNQLNAGVLVGAVRYAIERQRQHVALGNAYSRLEREVRDRRRAEDLLRRQAGELNEAKERFQKAFDHAPIGMAITGLDGRFREVNPAFSEMLGYEPAELLERSLTDMSSPAGAGPDATDLSRLRSGELATLRTETRLVDRQGREIWVLLSAAAVNGPEGRPLHFICQCEDITERKQAEARLVHRALHDALTGLPNRVLFQDRLEQALSRMARNPRALGVMFLDLDRFKEVNDSLGHEAGDQLIVEVARRIRGALRPSDTVARFGGDEFVVLLEGLPSETEAMVIAERVRAAVSAPFRLGAHDVAPTVSVGVTMAYGECARPAQLLGEADMAMYRAKERGGDGLESFSGVGHEA